MAHPFLTAVVLFVFWAVIISVVEDMANDQKAIIRFVGYVVVIVLAIATLLFILTQYLGVKF